MELNKQVFHFKEDSLTITVPKIVKDRHDWCMLPVMRTNIVSNIQLYIGIYTLLSTR